MKITNSEKLQFFCVEIGFPDFQHHNSFESDPQTLYEVDQTRNTDILELRKLGRMKLHQSHLATVCSTVRCSRVYKTHSREIPCLGIFTSPQLSPISFILDYIHLPRTASPTPKNHHHVSRLAHQTHHNHSSDSFHFTSHSKSLADLTTPQNFLAIPLVRGSNFNLLIIMDKTHQHEISVLQEALKLVNKYASTPSPTPSDISTLISHLQQIAPPPEQFLDDKLNGFIVSPYSASPQPSPLLPTNIDFRDNLLYLQQRNSTPTDSPLLSVFSELLKHTDFQHGLLTQSYEQTRFHIQRQEYDEVIKAIYQDQIDFLDVKQQRQTEMAQKRQMGQKSSHSQANPDDFFFIDEADQSISGSTGAGLKSDAKQGSRSNNAQNTAQSVQNSLNSLETPEYVPSVYVRAKINTIHQTHADLLALLHKQFQLHQVYISNDMYQHYSQLFNTSTLHSATQQAMIVSLNMPERAYDYSPALHQYPNRVRSRNSDILRPLFKDTILSLHRKPVNNKSSSQNSQQIPITTRATVTHSLTVPIFPPVTPQHRLLLQLQKHYSDLITHLQSFQRGSDQISPNPQNPLQSPPLPTSSSNLDHTGPISSPQGQNQQTRYSHQSDRSTLFIPPPSTLPAFTQYLFDRFNLSSIENNEKEANHNSHPVHSPSFPGQFYTPSSLVQGSTQIPAFHMRLSLSVPQSQITLPIPIHTNIAKLFFNHTAQDIAFDSILGSNFTSNRLNTAQSHNTQKLSQLQQRRPQYSNRLHLLSSLTTLLKRNQSVSLPLYISTNNAELQGNYLKFRFYPLNEQLLTVQSNKIALALGCSPQANAPAGMITNNNASNQNNSAGGISRRQQPGQGAQGGQNGLNNAQNGPNGQNNQSAQNNQNNAQNSTSGTDSGAARAHGTSGAIQAAQSANKMYQVQIKAEEAQVNKHKQILQTNHNVLFLAPFPHMYQLSSTSSLNDIIMTTLVRTSRFGDLSTSNHNSNVHRDAVQDQNNPFQYSTKQQNPLYLDNMSRNIAGIGVPHGQLFSAPHQSQTQTQTQTQAAMPKPGQQGQQTTNQTLPSQLQSHSLPHLVKNPQTDEDYQKWSNAKTIVQNEQSALFPYESDSDLRNLSNLVLKYTCYSESDIQKYSENQLKAYPEVVSSTKRQIGYMHEFSKFGPNGPSSLGHGHGHGHGHAQKNTNSAVSQMTNLPEFTNYSDLYKGYLRKTMDHEKDNDWLYDLIGLGAFIRVKYVPQKWVDSQKPHSYATNNDSSNNFGPNGDNYSYTGQKIMKGVQKLTDATLVDINGAISTTLWKDGHSDAVTSNVLDTLEYTDDEIMAKSGLLREFGQIGQDGRSGFPLSQMNKQLNAMGGVNGGVNSGGLNGFGIVLNDQSHTNMMLVTPINNYGHKSPERDQSVSNGSRTPQMTSNTPLITNLTSTSAPSSTPLTILSTPALDKTNPMFQRSLLAATSSPSMGMHQQQIAQPHNDVCIQPVSLEVPSVAANIAQLTDILTTTIVDASYQGQNTSSSSQTGPHSTQPASQNSKSTQQSNTLQAMGVEIETHIDEVAYQYIDIPLSQITTLDQRRVIQDYSTGQFLDSYELLNDIRCAMESYLSLLKHSAQFMVIPSNIPASHPFQFITHPQTQYILNNTTSKQTETQNALGWIGVNVSTPQSQHQSISGLTSGQIGQNNINNKPNQTNHPDSLRPSSLQSRQSSSLTKHNSTDDFDDLSDLLTDADYDMINNGSTAPVGSNTTSSQSHKLPQIEAVSMFPTSSIPPTPQHTLLLQRKAMDCINEAELIANVINFIRTQILPQRSLISSLPLYSLNSATINPQDYLAAIEEHAFATQNKTDFLRQKVIEMKHDTKLDDDLFLDPKYQNDHENGVDLGAPEGNNNTVTLNAEGQKELERRWKRRLRDIIVGYNAENSNPDDADFYGDRNGNDNGNNDNNNNNNNNNNLSINSSVDLCNTDQFDDISTSHATENTRNAQSTSNSKHLSTQVDFYSALFSDITALKSASRAGLKLQTPFVIQCELFGPIRLHGDPKDTPCYEKFTLRNLLHDQYVKDNDEDFDLIEDDDVPSDCDDFGAVGRDNNAQADNSLGQTRQIDGFESVTGGNNPESSSDTMGKPNSRSNNHLNRHKPPHPPNMADFGDMGDMPEDPDDLQAHHAGFDSDECFVCYQRNSDEYFERDIADVKNRLTLLTYRIVQQEFNRIDVDRILPPIIPSLPQSIQQSMQQAQLPHAAQNNGQNAQNNGQNAQNLAKSPQSAPTGLPGQQKQPQEPPLPPSQGGRTTSPAQQGQNQQNQQNHNIPSQPPQPNPNNQKGGFFGKMYNNLPSIQSVLTTVYDNVSKGVQAAGTVAQHAPNGQNASTSSANVHPGKKSLITSMQAQRNQLQQTLHDKQGHVLIPSFTPLFIALNTKYVPILTQNIINLLPFLSSTPQKTISSMQFALPTHNFAQQQQPSLEQRKMLGNPLLLTHLLLNLSRHNSITYFPNLLERSTYAKRSSFSVFSSLPHFEFLKQFQQAELGYLKQRLYEPYFTCCLTCRIPSICPTCSMKCHKNHRQITFSTFQNARCYVRFALALTELHQHNYINVPIEWRWGSNQVDNLKIITEGLGTTSSSSSSSSTSTQLSSLPSASSSKPQPLNDQLIQTMLQTTAQPGIAPLPTLSPLAISTYILLQYIHNFPPSLQSALLSSTFPFFNKTTRSIAYLLPDWTLYEEFSTDVFYHRGAIDLVSTGHSSAAQSTVKNAQLFGYPYNQSYHSDIHLTPSTAPSVNNSSLQPLFVKHGAATGKSASLGLNTGGLQNAISNGGYTHNHEELLLKQPYTDIDYRPQFKANAGNDPQFANSPFSSSHSLHIQRCLCDRGSGWPSHLQPWDSYRIKNDHNSVIYNEKKLKTRKCYVSAYNSKIKRDFAAEMHARSVHQRGNMLQSTSDGDGDAFFAQGGSPQALLGSPIFATTHSGVGGNSSTTTHTGTASTVSKGNETPDFLAMVPNAPPTTSHVSNQGSKAGQSDATNVLDLFDLMNQANQPEPQQAPSRQPIGAYQTNPTHPQFQPQQSQQQPQQPQQQVSRSSQIQQHQSHHAQRANSNEFPHDQVKSLQLRLNSTNDDMYDNLADELLVGDSLASPPSAVTKEQQQQQQQQSQQRQQQQHQHHQPTTHSHSHSQRPIDESERLRQIAQQTLTEKQQKCLEMLIGYGYDLSLENLELVKKYDGDLNNCLDHLF